MSIYTQIAALAVAGIVGWTANGWRKNAEIAELKAERSAEVATQSQAALKNLADATKVIKKAADGAHVDTAALNTKLSAIQRSFENANAKPLPVDCRFDAPRVLKLTTSIDTINKAIAR